MTRYFAYCQGDILLTREGNIPLSLPFAVQPWQRVTELTIGEESAVVVRLDAPYADDHYRMEGLRKTFDLLSPADYQLAGKCAELIYWDGNSKFCGCCGAPMQWQTEISKQCSLCGKELWPSLATAIIVRVTKGDDILLVRSRNFRGPHYGLVAGFVETGESLEQCVAREVWEETHLRVANIRYFSSQPWPYPAGLMVGFTADYESGELQLQRSELTEGGWFSRNCLPEVPNRSSLARWLIDDWMKKD
ncbi:MAG: NAD(+) diphosphatase [Bacteroidaceae bacterium]|nr:NAD(+) diphosphatase [Bacteroidaceae bacterium]